MTATNVLRHARILATLIGSLAIVAAAVGASPQAESALPPSPEPLRILVPKLAAQIRIDGNLDEAVWSKAAVCSDFLLNKSARPGRQPTELRLWYDDVALYLGWICKDVDIQSTFTNRDSRFWEEEVVEFFFTAGSLGRYYELQWNPLGAVFDAIITNDLDERGRSKAFRGDWSFTATNMASAARVRGTVNHSSDRDEAWIVEVRLPFADFAFSTPAPGTVWRANFYRFNRDTGEPVEELAWSPTRLEGFHEPSRFGYLEFGAAPKPSVSR